MDISAHADHMLLKMTDREYATNNSRLQTEEARDEIKPLDLPTPPICHWIERVHKDENMVVEGSNGKYLNIRVKMEHNKEKLHFQCYNRNKHFYTFFFALFNDVEKLNQKLTYFAIKKPIKEIEEMGVDNHNPLI